MNRVSLRQLAALVLCLMWPAPGSADDATVRIVAANISSGRFQSYPNPGPGTRILEALAPDVVLIQEFNVNDTPNAANDEAAVRAWVDDVFGSDYHFFREPGGDSIPNGVISRWPIAAAGEWRDPEVSNRDFAFARIDVPGPVDLWVVSVHLLTRGSGVRDRQARELVARIESVVPPDDYLVVGGDFNTDRRTEPAIATLGRIVDTLGPFPDDGAEPSRDGTNRSRRKPFDWVLADADLEVLAAATRVGDLFFPDGLVFDSRVFDHDELEESFAPVRPDDSDAPQMQHMAVVRDFRIPTVESPEIEDLRLDPTAVDYGVVDADAGAVSDDSIRITVVRPISLTAVAFAGSHPEEFSLASPDGGDLPAALADGASLIFRWRPAANDGAPRSVTATLVTDGEPGAVEVALHGVPRRPDPGGGPPVAAPIDLGGFRLVQTGGDASLTFPAATLLAPGALVVIGRDATRPEFEGFWGELGPDVIYLNGRELAGDPGFPIVNGGERFRLLDAAGQPTDPLDLLLPVEGMRRGESRERLTTGGPDFLGRDQLAATPGRFAGERAPTGRVVVTEISDARQFQFEFVELLHDAPAAPPESPEHQEPELAGLAEIGGAALGLDRDPPLAGALGRRR